MTRCDPVRVSGVEAAVNVQAIWGRLEASLSLMYPLAVLAVLLNIVANE